MDFKKACMFGAALLASVSYSDAVEKQEAPKCKECHYKGLYVGVGPVVGNNKIEIDKKNFKKDVFGFGLTGFVGLGHVFKFKYGGIYLGAEANFLGQGSKRARGKSYLAIPSFGGSVRGGYSKGRHLVYGSWGLQSIGVKWQDFSEKARGDGIPSGGHYAAMTEKYTDRSAYSRIAVGYEFQIYPHSRLRAECAWLLSKTQRNLKNKTNSRQAKNNTVDVKYSGCTGGLAWVYGF